MPNHLFTLFLLLFEFLIIAITANVIIINSITNIIFIITFFIIIIVVVITIIVFVYIYIYIYIYLYKDVAFSNLVRKSAR